MEKGTSSVLPRNAKWLLFCLFTSTITISWATGAYGEGFPKNFHRKCRFTRYPNSCTDTLLARQGLGVGHRHVDLVSLLVEKTIDEVQLTSSSVSNQSVLLDRIQNQQAYEVLGYCDELMQMSLKRLNQSLRALKDSPQQSKQDIQTWLSAVLTFHDSCRDQVTTTNISGVLFSQICAQMDHLSVLASNALALANFIPGGGSNRRLTSEHDIPTWVSAKDRRFLQSTGIQADVVVAQDGSGHYSTLSEAIEGASSGGGRYVIYVKAGEYKEKLSVSKDNVMLIGDGKEKTIITNSNSVGGGSSMPGSATVVVSGDNFIARDIGFQNAAGPKGEQALALRIASDHAVLYRCSLQGYQDTLYAVALRQFYRECDIYGTIDFIFGNAAAVFQNCNLILRRPSSGAYNAIMANGRSDPGQSTGFVAQNCRIAAGSDLYSYRHSMPSYLGRPWKQFSRAVVMQSSIDDSIQSRGWVEWSGGFALKSLYFAEYLNGGPGARTSGRVQWPGYHVLGASEASKFTVANFIYGNSWLPSTGVDFDAGL